MINKGLQYHTNGALKYLTVKQFSKTNLVNHAYTTRYGGVSIGAYATLNMNFTKNDTKENVKKNLNILCDEIHVKWEDLVFAKQIHSDQIQVVTEKELGTGVTREDFFEGVDGLITNCSKVPLLCYSADCVLLCYLDPVNKVIGVAHSGWQGTVKKIGAKMVARMTEEFGTKPEDCLVSIGPSIGPEKFEIEQDVMHIFKEAFGEMENYTKIKNETKYLVDLWSINVDLLKEAGIKEENITLAALCTMSDPELFFSYRAMKGKNGSLAAVIELK